MKLANKKISCLARFCPADARVPARTTVPIRISESTGLPEALARNNGLWSGYESQALKWAHDKGTPRVPVNQDGLPQKENLHVFMDDNQPHYLYLFTFISILHCGQDGHNHQHVT